MSDQSAILDEKPAHKPHRKRKSFRKQWKRQLQVIRSYRWRIYQLSVQVISGLLVGSAMIFMGFWVPVGRKVPRAVIPNQMPDETWQLLIVIGVAYCLGVIIGLFMSGYFMRLKSSPSGGCLGVLLGGFLALVIGVLLSVVAPMISFLVLLILPIMVGMLDYHAYGPDDEDDDED